jgi:uncharacterized membrane protein YbhN (UPF0104 family)
MTGEKQTAGAKRFWQRIPAWVKLLGSLVLAAGLLAFLFSRMNAQTLAETLRNARAKYLFFTAAAAAAYWLVRLDRWRWMTFLAGAGVSWRTAAISMFAGLGVGLVTPMRSGEVVRPLFVPQGARAQLAGFVALERCFDLLAVLLLAVPGWIYLVATGKLGAWASVAAVGLFLAAAAPLAVLMLRPRRLLAVMARKMPRKLRPALEIQLPPKVLARMILTSLLAEALSVLAVYLSIRSLGDFSLAAAYGFVPVVMLNNLLPLTPGGLGLRELIARYVFAPMGYADTLIVTGYLINSAIVLYLPGLAGIALAWRAGMTRMLHASSQSADTAS